MSKEIPGSPLRVIPGSAPRPRAVARPGHSRAQRGVRLADYTIDGHRVLEGIDRQGNCVRRVKLVPGVPEEAAREWLSGYIEHVEERASLRAI